MKRILIELSVPPETNYERGDKIFLGKSIKALPGEAKLNLAKQMVEQEIKGYYFAPKEVQSKIDECKARISADIAKLSKYAEILGEMEELNNSMNQKSEQIAEYKNLAKELSHEATKEKHRFLGLLKKVEETP